MAPIGHQRIAQRFRVTTTPIHWLVPKRKGLDARSKLYSTEAAVIELSVMGAAIVCPLKWRAVTGARVQIEWEGITGFVHIRREVPFPGSSKVAMYGVEFADNPSVVGKALFDHLVAEPAAKVGAKVAAAAAEAVIGGYEEAPAHDPGQPVMWTAPGTWSAGSEPR
jgi:hypothetical protein